jgi:malonyl CoA-acyl carrier protein transacylase
MNREDIIRMANEAGAQRSHNPELWDIWNISDQELERFVAIVAKHTLANIDPSSFMSWQEGYAAGAAAEREACADACDQQANAWQQAAWSHSAIEAHAIRQCAAAIRSRKENT